MNCKPFRATIYKVGINRRVDVPAKVVSKLGDDPYINVAATVNGYSFPGTLLPRGGGERRLYLNTAVRKTNGVDTGDEVEIALAFDPTPRDPLMPGDLAEAFDRRPGVWETFELLAPGLRREILQWIGKAKRAETRLKRIRRLFERLELKRRRKKS
jgi:hypothetical protein